MGSKGRRNDTAPFDPVAEGAMPPVVPTPQRRSTDISLAKSDIKDLDHDGHGRQVSANPLPPTAAKPSNTRVELQDQTNFLPFRQLLLVFAGLSMAMGCPMLDQTMLTTALPTLGKTFGRADIVNWVGTAYLLTSTPMYGRLSDIFGRKPCLLVSLAIFFIGALGCSVSQSMIMLIVFRAVAGVGGGGILTLTGIIVSDIVTLQERGKYQGIIGVVIGLCNGLGPIIGGSLTEKATWRACWWLVMPIIAIAFALILYLLPLKRVTGSYRSKLAQIDWLGSFLTLAWVMLVLVALSWAGSQYSWDSAAVLAPLILGIALLGASIYTEAHVRLPLIPLYIFRDSTVSAGMATTFFSGIAYYGVMYQLPQYFQQVHGASAIRSGLLVLPLTCVQTVWTFGAGFLTSKTGDYWYMLSAGFAIWTVGLGMMATIGTSTSDAKLIGYEMLLAAGAGLTFQTSLLAIQATVERKDMATATGTRNFARMVGGTVGLAACGTIVNNLASKELASKGYDAGMIGAIINDPVGSQLGAAQSEVEAIKAAYGHGIRGVFYLLVPCIGISFFLTVFLIKRVPLKRADDAQRKLDGKAWLQGEKARKAAEREKVGAVKVPPRDPEASQSDHGLEVGRREMQR